VARWVEDRQDAGQPVPVTDAPTRKAGPGLLAAQRHRPAHRRRHGGQLKDFAGLYLEELELNSRH
jgi:hypothetical protein